MQAYKLKGTIDPSGHLIIDEPINLSPGEVEVIILQPVTQAEESKVPTATSPTEVSKQRLRANYVSVGWHQELSQLASDSRPRATSIVVDSPQSH